MSVNSILANYAAESSKPAAKQEDYVMSLESYFTPDYEMESNLDAAQILLGQLANLESVEAIVVGANTELTPVAANMLNQTIIAAMPYATFGESMVSLFDVEEEKEEGKTAKKSMFDKDKLKANAKKIKDEVMRLIKKASNFIADYYRKFKTGTEKLVTKLEETKAALKGDIEIEKASPAFFIESKQAKASQLKTIATAITNAFVPEDEDGTATMQLPGNKVVTIKTEKGGKSTITVKDFGDVAQPKVSMSKSDAEAMLDAAIELAKDIGKIDHKKVSAMFDKDLKTLIENGAKMDVANTRVSYMRAITVTIPTLVAKALTGINAGIASGSKETKDGDK